jgi:uncharacterized protein (DUF924 family)
MPGDGEADEADIFLALFSEWYGIAPHWSRFKGVKGEAFQTLWTTLWFAKGALTAPLDARLKQTYRVCFDVVEPFLAEGVPEAPSELPPPFKKIWLLGVMILCDQVSRNVFRNSARAYATDKLARRIAENFLGEFDALPVPVRVSLILVLVHSEDLEDWGLAPRPDGDMRARPHSQTMRINKLACARTHEQVVWRT